MRTGTAAVALGSLPAGLYQLQLLDRGQLKAASKLIME